MLQVRKSSERGHFNHGWLDTYHSFSFADYYDPNWTHFRYLRVINQDIVQPGQGFGTHSHRDMEIITLVLRGAVTHKDSMGNQTIIRPGEIQRMTAGAGVTHSEFNCSKDEPLELLQIWIFPEQKGLTPSYKQITYQPPHNRLCLLASRTQEDNAVLIHQDVKLWIGQLNDNQRIDYQLASSRHAWLQVISGKLSIKNLSLSKGDGLAVSAEDGLSIQAIEEAQFLLFDLN